MPEEKHPAKRLVFLLSGILFLILGIIGLILPIIPGIAFLILALTFLAKGSTKFYNWLLNNPWFGYYLKKLGEGKGLPLIAKITTIALISLSTIFNIVFLIKTPWLKILSAIIPLIVIIWVLKQPTVKK